METRLCLLSGKMESFKSGARGGDNVSLGLRAGCEKVESSFSHPALVSTIDHVSCFWMSPSKSIVI
jgi:hypothetical protein